MIVVSIVSHIQMIMMVARESVKLVESNSDDKHFEQYFNYISDVHLISFAFHEQFTSKLIVVHSARTLINHSEPSRRSFSVVRHTQSMANENYTKKVFGLALEEAPNLLPRQRMRNTIMECINLVKSIFFCLFRRWVVVHATDFMSDSLLS